MRMFVAPLFFSLATASGCATDMTASGDGEPTAQAALRLASGEAAGRATATREGGDIRIRVEGQGLSAGTHAVHVHTTGKCDAPAFETAGGHWNPTSAHHGRDNPQSPRPHKGDLPNMDVSAGGTGQIEFLIPNAAIVGGGAALLDGDGAAVVIHAAADDYRTDPTGNAGGRLACGVFG